MHFGNEKADITTKVTYSKRMREEYYKQFYAKKLINLDKQQIPEYQKCTQEETDKVNSSMLKY